MPPVENAVAYRLDVNTAFSFSICYLRCSIVIIDMANGIGFFVFVVFPLRIIKVQVSVCG